MAVKQAIILAGGLGTRLREVVPVSPKCMAPVAGRPFLYYVINYLRCQGIEDFIFSLCHKHEIIEAYLKEQFPTLRFQCIVESEPLGTGGAIRLAMEYADGENILVANGDSLFKINLEKLSFLHEKVKADCTIALKQMKEYERYGSVQLKEDGSVDRFEEKKFTQLGNINAGNYLLNRKRFLQLDLPQKFSFEKEYLEKAGNIFGQVQDGYFIDIGIPEDYQQAQEDLRRPPLDLAAIDKSWTLLVDRDGVINYEKVEDYILNWDEFKFYEGVRECFPILSRRFGRIVIISNQRGVGRKIMTEADLVNIHQNLRNEIEAAGGRIDGIYYCTSTDNTHPNRKPNPGMAFQAVKDFPDIDLSKTIMVGNKSSDMLFGRYAGTYTIYVRTTHPAQAFPHPDIDFVFESLPDFAQLLNNG